jgi:hypothetical protein
VVAPRFCTECAEPIPAKRLQAQPNAQQCVSCLEMLGDVIPYKRYDEQAKDEVVSTVFLTNPYIESQIKRTNTLAPPDKAYEAAVGDDSFLKREDDETLGHAYHMSEAFERDEEEEEQPAPEQAQPAPQTVQPTLEPPPPLVVPFIPPQPPLAMAAGA